MKKIILLSFGVLAVGFTVSSCLSKTVLVKAWAEDDYRVSSTGEQIVRTENYVFFEGHFEPGNSKTLLGRDEFEEICEYLEKALELQNYVRVDDDYLNPDLLIVVDWGQTTVKINTGVLELPSGISNGPNVIHTQDPDPCFEEINAELLGTSEWIYGNTSILEKDAAKWATNKERYFFILSAYDFRKVTRKKTDPLWTTKFSVEAKWKHYDEALVQLSEVAANYFGKNVDDITFERSEAGKPKVEYGEIEVIETLGEDSE